MSIKTPESFARINSLAYVFADAAQRGYLDYLSLEAPVANLQQVEYHPEVEELTRKFEIAGYQTIVFAGMCFESAIYDYAAVHLGDKYVRDHLDKLDVLSKWVVCLRLVSGHTIAKDQAPYAALKRLVTARNRLVHSKSEPLSMPNMEAQFARLMSEGKDLEQDVHNAFWGYCADVI